MKIRLCLKVPWQFQGFSLFSLSILSGLHPHPQISPICYLFSNTSHSPTALLNLDPNLPDNPNQDASLAPHTQPSKIELLAFHHIFISQISASLCSSQFSKCFPLPCGNHSWQSSSFSLALTLNPSPDNSNIPASFQFSYPPPSSNLDPGTLFSGSLQNLLSGILTSISLLSNSLSIY